MFLFGGEPVRVGSGDGDEPTLAELDVDKLRHEVARAADWYTVVMRDKEWVEVDAMPPLAVIKDMLATPEPPLPVLARIVSVPVFASDGTLLTRPGYHAAARTYFAPAASFTVPTVSEQPSEDEIGEAIEVLHEPLLDFPFVDKPDRAHAIAMGILPFVRDMIDGPTPLHLIEKACPGTGATLMVDCLSYAFTGRSIETLTKGNSEQENRKLLTSALLRGQSHIALDNLGGRLDSGAIASALTTNRWGDRLLGANEMVGVPVRCVWIATGNNPALSMEVARRTISIRLDAKDDRPWLRTGFTHPDLGTWIKQNRSRYVWAVLTLTRAWIAAGKVSGDIKLGKYEEWSQVIGGILKFAAIDGFLANLAKFYDDVDEDGRALRGFIEGWWQTHHSARLKAAELFPLAQEIELDLGEGKEHSQKCCLGRLILKNRDRVFALKDDVGPFRVQLVRDGDAHGVALWKLHNMENATE